MKAEQAIAYGALVVLNAGLAALSGQLGAGKVPLPESAAWLVPVLVAMLTALTALLPAVGRGPDRDDPG